MESTESATPDDGPLGEQKDIEPADVAEADLGGGGADGADETAYTEVETDPLGGTGGVSSGGAG